MLRSEVLLRRVANSEPGTRNAENPTAGTEYDGLNRLIEFHRGTLSGGDITSKVRNEAWGLSPTGNWSDYQIDADGDGNYTDATDLDQDRTHNPVNEITGITEQADPQQTQWADPVWNARGNMTTVPKPSDLTGTYAATYDAWNRLAFVWVDSNSDGDHDAGETVIARYEYDGLNRRTKKHLNADTDDDFDTFRHFFYNAAWQILETRLSESENTGPETLQPEYQYVWSLRYIDAAVLRDENTDTDDLCDDERLYYLTDANMNVTCLVESDGDVAERYIYDPYGNVKVYSDNWSTEVAWAASKKNNIRFCGYYFDNETGLYNPRTRYYHPLLGRFVQRDPDALSGQTGKEPMHVTVGGALHRHYTGGNSLYQYVSSEPVTRSDPEGLQNLFLGSGVVKRRGTLVFSPGPDAGYPNPNTPENAEDVRQQVEEYNKGCCDCRVVYYRVSTKYKGFSMTTLGHSWIESPAGNYGWAGGGPEGIYFVGWGDAAPDITRFTCMTAQGVLKYGGKQCLRATCDDVYQCLELAAIDFATRFKGKDELPSLLRQAWAAITHDPEPRGGVTCITFAEYLINSCCLRYK